MGPIGDLNEVVVENKIFSRPQDDLNGYPGGTNGDGSPPGGPNGDGSFPGGPLSNERFTAAAGGKKSGGPAISASALAAVTNAIGGSV